MKNQAFLLLYTLLIIAGNIKSQNLYHKVLPHITDGTPEWARMMYSDTAPVAEVLNLYHHYYENHNSIKNQHTQNFKYWIQHVNTPSASNSSNNLPPFFNSTNTNWEYIGPTQSYYFNDKSGPGIMHANIYCLSRSNQNPDLLIAGSEAGGAYVSYDRGITWDFITRDLPIWTIDDVLIDPEDDNTWYISGRARTYYRAFLIFKTKDQGKTWEEVLNLFWKNDVNRWNNIDAMEIHPDGYLIAGTGSGVFLIQENGEKFHTLENKIVHDLKLDPNNPSHAYALTRSQDQSLIEFYKSTDGGFTFNKINSGWYESDGTKDDNKAHGGRIAISKYHPGLIYVVVAADLKEEDRGYLGIFKSEDFGESFTIPTGHLGAPYSDDHLNLLSSNRDGTGYHQGHFNIGIDINPTNRDQVLVGGIAMNRTEDGGKSFMRITGWDNQGGFPSEGFHADVQDIHVFEDCTIISNDGGIAYSENIFEDNYEIDKRHIGLLASSFRGYGQGWNTDIIVGGTNHNGDRYINRDVYPEGTYWTIGGGEAASGTVNPGDNSLYLEKSSGNGWADAITGVIQRRKIKGVFENIEYLPDIPVASNTSVLFSWGSNIEFEPHCFNNWYTGSGNSLLHITQNGLKIDTVAVFESPYTRVVNQVIIPRYDPDVIYVSTRDVNAVPIGQENLLIFKSKDKGKTWSKVFGSKHYGGYVPSIRFDIDHSKSGRIIVTILDPSAMHESHRQVYYSENDGLDWVDLSSDIFRGQEINNIIFYQGSNSLFLGTEIGVYEYDFDNQLWKDISVSAGGAFFANMPKIFYRDSKLRYAFHGMGIWEYALEENAEVIVTPTVNKRISDQVSDIFQLECYSFLNHEGATWEWSFSEDPKSIDSYNIRNPKVEFEGPVSVDVTLTITKKGKKFSKTVDSLIQIIPADKDGDGFNIAEDCNDFLASSNPLAFEISDNEIDENCDGVYAFSENDDFQFYSIVNNIDTIWGEGTSGPLSINGKGHFFPLVAGGNCLGGETKLFSAVGFYGKGKIGAITYPGILRNDRGVDQFDNLDFGVQLMEWLNGRKGKRIAFQEGWANRNTHSIYLNALQELGYSISYIKAPYTFDKLEGVDILIYGEDWLNGAQVGNEEIDVYHDFISSGGSSLFFGLGWSWPNELDDYPPNRFHKEIGLEWLRGNIRGVEHIYKNYPLFLNFAPQFDMDCDGYAIDEDCNDSNPLIHPGAQEIVGNEIDENCNGEVAVDQDGDGFNSEVDCDDENALINPLVSEIPYNGIDDDCNSETLDDDLDQDGFGINEDCDDENALINPDEEDIPDNGIDENCDGEDAMMTSIFEENKVEIKIYPNPSNDKIFIKSTNVYTYKLSIINTTGQLVAECYNCTEVLISKYPPGVYIMKFTDKSNKLIFSENLIIQK